MSLSFTNPTTTQFLAAELSGIGTLYRVIGHSQPHGLYSVTCASGPASRLLAEGLTWTAACALAANAIADELRIEGLALDAGPDLA